MEQRCHQSKKVHGTCDVCGRDVEVLHMPEEIHGFYCEKCCPVCAEGEQVQRRVA